MLGDVGRRRVVGGRKGKQEVKRILGGRGETRGEWGGSGGGREGGKGIELVGGRRI